MSNEFKAKSQLNQFITSAPDEMISNEKAWKIYTLRLQTELAFKTWKSHWNLDEATEGVAPLVCEEIWQGLTILKERGLSILVVDKNIEPLLRISNRVSVMEKGQVVWSDTAPFTAFTDAVKMRYLGV